MPRNAKRGGGDGFGLKYSQKAADETPDDNFKDDTNQSGPTNGLAAKWTVIRGDAATVELPYPPTVGYNNYDLSVSGRARCLISGGPGSGVNDQIQWRQDWTLGQNESILACMGIGLLTNYTMASRDYNPMRVGICINDNDLTPRTGNYVSCGWATVPNDFAIVSDTNTRAEASAHAYTSWVADAIFRISRDDSTPPKYDCHAMAGDSDTWHQIGSDDSPGSATMTNLWFEAWPGTTNAGPYQVTLNWIRKGAYPTYDPWPYE